MNNTLPSNTTTLLFIERLSLSVFLTLMCTFGFVFYLSVWLIVVRHYKEFKNPFYLYMISAGLPDMVFLLITLFYCIPCIVSSRDIYASYPLFLKVLGYVQIHIWLTQNLHIFFVAINRWSYVASQSYTRLFSFFPSCVVYRRTIGCIIFLWLSSLSLPISNILTDSQWRYSPDTLSWDIIKPIRSPTKTDQSETSSLLIGQKMDQSQKSSSDWLLKSNQSERSSPDWLVKSNQSEKASPDWLLKTDQSEKSSAPIGQKIDQSETTTRNYVPLMEEIDLCVLTIFPLLATIFYAVTWTIIVVKRKNTVGDQSMIEQTSKREVRLLVQFSIITGAVIVYLLAAWLAPLAETDETKMVGQILLNVLGNLNSSINPFVYLLFDQKIKLAAKTDLKSFLIRSGLRKEEQKNSLIADRSTPAVAVIETKKRQSAKIGPSPDDIAQNKITTPSTSAIIAVYAVDMNNPS